jgi:RNA polymerase sigma-70 factor (ECF subfamily)
MPATPQHYAEGPEALIVSLAARGDRDAYTELVRRRQSWIRNFMRRCCGDDALADDLAQQVFLQTWRKVRQLRDPTRFGSWLKRVAVNEWIQHQRKDDPLWHAKDEAELQAAPPDATAVAMDLDRALAALPASMRLCVVLSYHERLSHREIAELTGMQLGTVKTNIRRGSKRLRELLSDYGEPA